MLQKTVKEKTATVTGKIPSRYDLDYAELSELINTARYAKDERDIFKAITQAFDLGFLRGARAAQRGRVKKL